MHSFRFIAQKLVRLNSCSCSCSEPSIVELQESTIMFYDHRKPGHRKKVLDTIETHILRSRALYKMFVKDL